MTFIFFFSDSEAAARFWANWRDLECTATSKESSHRSKARQVLVLGATDKPWEIKDSMRKMFFQRLYIPLPDRETRLRLIKNLLVDQLHTLPTQQLNDLVNVTNGYSGSDLTMLTKEALISPLRAMGDSIISASSNSLHPVNYDDFAVSLLTVRPSVAQSSVWQFCEW
ncbi:P-loop containing nucleoside triphosphate hydrolase protein [Lipomyces japonicus]|uniref:P-loop containing nucleoside triphosphate hydrolase protein n=1 Tax=Lipomyces japonicus TaxID=56871 RepID=UPI0034CF8495